VLHPRKFILKIWNVELGGFVTHNGNGIDRLYTSRELFAYFTLADDDGESVFGGERTEARELTSAKEIVDELLEAVASDSLKPATM
jgi:hypothetical protein